MEVIISDFKNHPSCPHGPCLMFKRSKTSGNNTGKKFFACSACRDRSSCEFFQWVGDDLSAESNDHWKQMSEKLKPPLSHKEYVARLKSFKELPSEKRKYCKSCSLLVINANESHIGHNICEKISDEDLLLPSTLFETKLNKKSEAQYFFSKKTVQFVVSLLKNLGFSKLVLLGVPKIHEYLSVKDSEVSGLSSFLMDIDHRYMQFFGPNQFCHYNLFNNHFFAGKKSRERFKEFLIEGSNGKIAVLLDPPFGGLIDPICQTIKCITEWWRKKNNKTIDKNIPLLWFFPYFNEGRILKNLPDMIMMDYKVEYANHAKLKAKKESNSPVRIFTNITPSSFILPAAEGYWLCTKCDRYIFKENQHCQKCNACTTKHGKTYKHCDLCQQCVKSSYQHCANCNKCGAVCTDTPGISCQKCKFSQNTNAEVCYRCFGMGHRKRACMGSVRNMKKRRRKK